PKVLPPRDPSVRVRRPGRSLVSSPGGRRLPPVSTGGSCAQGRAAPHGRDRPMPALVQRPRRLPGRGVPLAASALVACLLVGVGVTAPGAVDAKDWSPYIASLRGSQLAYEGAMRAADIQIKAIDRTLKRTRRAVTRAERAVERRRERHA